MVSIVVKINKILTFFILLIVLISMFFIGIFMFKGKKEEDPEKFLKSLGYTIEFIDEQEINLPENFGEGLEKYNRLQKRQGFDLEKYAGKNCLHKKYYVSSKKIYPEKYVANILTYENKLIGGDLHSQYYKQKLLKLKSIC